MREWFATHWINMSRSRTICRFSQLDVNYFQTSRSNMTYVSRRVVHNSKIFKSFTNYWIRRLLAPGPDRSDFRIISSNINESFANDFIDLNESFVNDWIISSSKKFANFDRVKNFQFDQILFFRYFCIHLPLSSLLTSHLQHKTKKFLKMT